MKRDMDLARTILEQVEDKSDGTNWVDLVVPDRTQAELGYHVMLLDQAGLLTAEEVSNTEIQYWRAIKLTWDGHEFLDAIRNDTVWSKVKETAKEKGSAMPFEIIKQLAMKFAASLFGL